MADLIPRDSQNQEQKQEQQQQPSVFDELRSKKGFKDNDSFAKSYQEIEQTYGKTQNAFNSAKQNIESQSQGNYTLDEKGNMVLTEQGKQAQTQTQGHYGQQYQQGYQQPADPIYDPYTNQPIQDPIALQLAQLPLGQREAFLFNAMADQREKQQMSAFSNETEVLSSEAAKGFEQDVKKVMMSLPLAERAKKDSWNRALLQVKGARYDQDKQNWSQQGVEGFLNKAQSQPLQASSGSQTSGTQLPSDLEQQYRWYEKNRPGFFKDRSEFMKFTTPTGGK